MVDVGAAGQVGEAVQDPMEVTVTVDCDAAGPVCVAGQEEEPTLTEVTVTVVGTGGAVAEQYPDSVLVTVSVTVPAADV